MSTATAALARLRGPPFQTRMRVSTCLASRRRISSAASNPAAEPVLSTVHRGAAFEHRAMVMLRDLSMSLRRVGGKDDGGIDLLGWWWLPPLPESKSETFREVSNEPSLDVREDPERVTTDKSGIQRRRVRVLAQCKAERKKLGPNYVREMEGVLHRHMHLRSMSLDTETRHACIALLISESAFTKATVLSALSSPLPFLLLHLPRTPLDAPDSKTPIAFGSAIWNPALGSHRGVLAGEVDLRWERSQSANGDDRPTLWWRGARLESWVPSSER